MMNNEASDKWFYIIICIIEKLHQLEAEYETQYLKIFKSDFQDMQIKIHEMNSQ